MDARPFLRINDVVLAPVFDARGLLHEVEIDDAGRDVALARGVRARVAVVLRGINAYEWKAYCCSVGGQSELLRLFFGHRPDDAAPQQEAPPALAGTAPALIQEACSLLDVRGQEYDSPEGERSMGKAVAAFNAITGQDLSEAEGWLLLQVLKDVRQWSRAAYHHDSALDCIAFAGLKAEALHKGLKRLAKRLDAAAGGTGEGVAHD